MPGADVGGLLRSGVISLCLAAGVLHVSAAADHRGMAGHVAFFLVVAVAQSALAAAILLARPGRWLAVGAAVNLAVALVWVLSRTTGLAVDGSSAPEAIGFKDGIATMLEIGAAAGAGLWWLLPDGARRVALPSGRLATTLLGTGVWAIGAAGLFAGHTHSPGHTHAAQHAHAPAAPNAVEQHPHSGDPGHHDDGRTHATPSQGTTHHPANHHHAPEARLTAVRTSTAGGHDHSGDHHPSRDHHPIEAQPVPSRAAGHHHDHVAAGPVAQDDSEHEGEGHHHSHEGGAGGDQRHSGDDHDHKHDEGGAGNDKGDEDGGASPLEDVLKLLQPR